MSITRRLHSIIFIAVSALFFAGLVSQPTHAATSTVTGTVSSSNGPVNRGMLGFFTTCQAYYNGSYAAGTYFDGGVYSLSVPDGTYRVGIRPDNGNGGGASFHSAKPSCEQATVVTISGNTTLDLVTLPGSTVTGTVSTSNGPVADGSVHFYASCEEYKGGQSAASAHFWSGGAYSVTLADGTYRVRISPEDGAAAIESWHNAQPTCDQATVVTVTGNTTQNLVAQPGSPVTGTVSSTNGPVPNGSVTFFATCQDYKDGNVAGSANLSGSKYTLTVPDGTYRVRISPYNGTGAVTSWHSAKPTCDQATVVTVNGNTTQNLVAQPGSEVRGTVSSTNGPVLNGSVSFYATCQDYKDGNAAGFAFLFGSSDYVVTVPDGTYRVYIRSINLVPVYSEVLSWHNAQRTCGEATVVTVNGDATLDLITMVGHRVTGSVSTSSGPVNSGVVAFFPSCDDQSATPGANASLFSIGQPYTVTVPSGTYRVFIAPDDGTGAVRSWHNAQPSCEQATVVSITGDDTLNLVALAPGGSPSPTPSVSPTPSASPSIPNPDQTQATPPPPGTQTVKAPPAKIKKGKGTTLAKSSSQGAHVTWKSTTKKVCSVKKFRVKGLKKGKCELKATAPAVGTFLAYSQRFSLRVK